MSNGSPKRTSSSLHFSAGLATGILSASLLQPADLLKTRVQQAPQTTLLSTLRTIANGPNALRSLWRGTLPSIIRTGFGSALYFSSLNALRRSSLFSSLTSAATTTTSSSSIGGGRGGAGAGAGGKPRYSNTTNLLSGALARTAAGFALMPVTVIKVRYESSLYAYTSLPGAAASILRTEGLRGFFAGSGATAARDAPYAGLYVLFYEQARSRLGRVLGKREEGEGNGMVGTGTQTASVNFASGVVAAVLATALTNPFDAVKTRLQLRPGEYGHMGRAAARMVREEGLKSLFDGLGLRVARKAMSSAIAWSLYEELVKAGEGKWIWSPAEDKV